LETGFFAIKFKPWFVQILAGIYSMILLFFLFLNINDDLHIIDFKLLTIDTSKMYTMKIDEFEEINLLTNKETEWILGVAKRRLNKYADNYSLVISGNTLAESYLDSLETEIRLKKLEYFCNEKKISLKFYEMQYNAMLNDSLQFNNTPTPEIWVKLSKLNRSIGSRERSLGENTPEYWAKLSYENNYAGWNELSSINEIEKLHFYRRLLDLMKKSR
ncbi:hypothetical protein ACFLYK_04170, partial [Candidatus Cloacimonadota bacterium]